MNNPFNITKAVDYTDEDIIKYWVDITNNNGFKNLLKPNSPMPMLILGSKGSGKTHLMRYFSYQLQKIRHKNNNKNILLKDKYIGIFMRCSGLNSEKFKGKGQTQDVWDVVFSYYIELWLGQLTLSILADLNINEDKQKDICKKILLLFEIDVDRVISSFEELAIFLFDLQRNLDFEINNCATSRSLSNLKILLSSGKLTYGIPKIIKNNLHEFSEVTFLYLIDELENITESQQLLINSLYREKELPTTFRLGARLYGIKTYCTLGSGEENVEGSEFEKIILDDYLRNNKKYGEFVKNICKNRLNKEGFNIDNINQIGNYIEKFDIDKFSKKIKNKKPKLKNAHFNKLEVNLKKIKIEQDNIEKIISNLSFEQDIIIEKANLMLFYRNWSKGKELLESSKKIKQDAITYKQNTKLKDNSLRKVIDYFKGDMIDQLARETDEEIPYCGIENFIIMSAGIPRNFLNLLKHSFRWSLYLDGNIPFKDGGIISEKSQAKGVLDTSDWFFDENRMPGEMGKKALIFLDRICKLIRETKYSDIPPECSICTFSIDLTELPKEFTIILDLLEKYSYLIVVNNRRQKNTNDKNMTYQINGVIAPHWELSIDRRGMFNLNKEEILTLLTSGEEFDKLTRNRINKYYAPFKNNNVTQNLFNNEH